MLFNPELCLSRLIELEKPVMTKKMMGNNCSVHSAYWLSPTLTTVWVCLSRWSCNVIFVVVYSVADQAWQLLKLYLDRLGPCDGHVYYRCVASKLLSTGAALPTWLVNDFKVRRLSNDSEHRTQLERFFYDWWKKENRHFFQTLFSFLCFYSAARRTVPTRQGFWLLLF